MRKSNSRKINYPFSKIFNSKRSFTQLSLNAHFFLLSHLFFFCSLIRSLLFFGVVIGFAREFFFLAETKNSQNTRYTNRIYIKTISTKKIALTVGTGAANVEPLPNSIDSNPSGTILIHYPCVHEK